MIFLVEDSSRKDGETTQPPNTSHNVKKDMAYNLLRTLYKRYPNYVSFDELAEYKDVLADLSGITIPAVQRNSENSHKPEFLAEAALAKLTRYIEKQDYYENYRITIKGIELLNAIDLNKSSRNLEGSTRFLLSLTGLLTVLTLTNVITSIYVKTKNFDSTLGLFVIFLLLSTLVIAIALIIYNKIKK